MTDVLSPALFLVGGVLAPRSGRVAVLARETGQLLREVELGRSLCGDGALSVTLAPGGEAWTQP